MCENQDSNSYGIFGIYEVEADYQNLKASINTYPIRGISLGEQFLADITSFMTSVFCRDCARIDSIALTLDGKVDVTISLRHPFNLPTTGPASAKNRLDLHLFDVQGLVFTDEGIEFSDAGVVANPGLLANADGFSGIFDNVIDSIYPTKNSLHPYKMFYEDSSEGNFDSQSLTTGFTDPYNPSGHNVFPMGSYYHPTVFRFDPEPGNPITFVLVVSASYGVSAKFDIQEGKPGNRLTPRYFLPRFNRYEAWKVNVSMPSYLNFLTSGDPNQTAEVRLDVWDWQDGKNTSTYWDFYTSRAGEFNLRSDIKTIVMHVPSLMSMPVLINGASGTDRNPRKYVTKIKDELGAPPGNYWGLVSVLDELDGAMSLVGFKRDGETPFLYNTIRTYQFFNVQVKSASTAVPENPVDVTPMGINGITKDIFVTGNYAYVTLGVLGLMVLDVSNPSKPVYVSSFDTYGSANRMAYNSSSKLLYIADGVAGLAIVNVTNPASPTLKGSFDIAGMNDARDVAVYAGYAYVADGENGVAIIDVRTPDLPSLVGNYSYRPQVRALALKGTYLYKLDETDGLEILSLSNPENPVSMNSLVVVGNNKKDIYIKDNVAAILLENRLVTADVSNALNPVLKGTLSFTSPAEGVYIIQGYAFVANGTAGIKAVSLENISSPAVIASYDTTGYSQSCCVWVDNLYVCDGDAGMLVMNVGGGGLNLRSRYITTGMAWGISISERNVFLASGYSGVKSINVDIPEQARIETTVNTPGYALDCDTNDTALYVTDSESGLAVISIENPSVPDYLNNIQFPSWESWHAWAVKISGTYTALWGPQEQSDYPDIILLDVTEKYIPAQLGHLTTSRDFFDLTFSSGYIYAAAGSGGVATIAIENPWDLEFSALYSNGKPCYSVESAINGICAMFENGGLEILSTADPDNLSKAGDVFTSGTSYDICLSGRYAYVSDLDGLVIIDVADLAHPIIITTHPVPGTVSEILVRGNYAYIAAREGGLRIIKLW